MARAAWTDKMLDDLDVRMGKGFERLDAGSREVRAKAREVLIVTQL
jgi:hypothetical protein